MRKEVWLDVSGYEGLYMVSNLGRLKHLPFIVQNMYRSRIVPERICKCHINNNGYYMANLYKNNTRKTMLLHRIVAIAHIPNPYSYQFVNHKNNIRTDCCVENLEWCTRSYNTKYSYDTNNRRDKMNWRKGGDNANAKSINMFSKDGEFVRRFECIMDAERETGVRNNSIVACLKGRTKTSGGYKWEYVK